jgi:NTE family protein
MKIKLVLSGCGTLFPIHIGVLRYLEDKHIEVSEIVGTSGGALVATMFAAGWTTAKMELVTNEVGIKSMADYSFNPFYRMGVIKGKKIKQALNKYLEGMTFKDTKIPLGVVVTNLMSQKGLVFNQIHSPDLKLAEAVRASMSIPLLFKYVKGPGGEILVDGGTMNNFALDHYASSKDTIGVRIKPTAKWTPGKGPVSYIAHIIDTLMAATERKHIEDAVYARIIDIKTEKSGVDFNQSATDVFDMIAEGYQAAEGFFKNFQSE